METSTPQTETKGPALAVEQPTEKPKYKFLTTEELKEWSDEKLAETSKELEITATKIGEEFKTKLYPVKVESAKNAKGLIAFLEKDAAWTHRNVPHLVAVYHGVKDGLAAGLDDAGNIFTKSLVIENLYQMLLSIEGKGYFEAKKYLTILTDIGGPISEAMKLLSDEQELFTNYHTDLASIDTEQTARAQGIQVEESHSGNE